MALYLLKDGSVMNEGDFNAGHPLSQCRMGGSD